MIDIKPMQSIADALKGLGATTGFNPKPTLAACNVLLAGDPKSGKSTLACGIPDSVYADLETSGGAHSVPHKSTVHIWAPVWHEAGLSETMKNPPPGFQKACSWTQLVAAVLDLAKKPNSPLRTVIIDHVDALTDMIIDKCEKQWGKPIEEYRGGMGGWGIIAEEFTNARRQFNRAGLGTVILSHRHLETKVVDVGNKKETREYTRYGGTPKSHKKLYGDVDFFITCAKYSAPGEKGTLITKYKAFTEARETDAGGRAAAMGGRIALTPTIELPLKGGWQVLEADYARAVAAYRDAINKP